MNLPIQGQFHNLAHFNFVLIVVFVAGSIILCLYLVVLVLRLLDFRRLLGRDTIFLELTPPAFSDKTPHAGQQFFSDLHGFETIRTIKDKLLLHKAAFSAEVVGTREQGIRYIFCVPKANCESFKKDIASFESDIRVQEVEDYPTKIQRLRARLLEFRLKAPYYPLEAHDMLEQSDPIGYTLGAMANLKPGEIMTLQLVLSPTRVRNAEKISSRLLHNKEHLDALGKRHHKSIGAVFMNAVSSSLFALTSTAGDIHHGSSNYSKQTQHGDAQHHRQVASGIKPARTMGSLELMLAQQVSDKLNGRLFRTNIRVLVVTNSARDGIARADDIRKSFNVYRTNYQAIKSRLNFPYSLRSRYRTFVFERRLPAIFNKNTNLLSANEVANIYHFPNSEANHNGDIVRSLSKDLPAPLAIKQHADRNDFGVELGINKHHGTDTAIGLTDQERERHVYIIGGTGNGKTTMLFYGILQDIRAGNGVAVIDPHGDLAVRILRYIPEERIKDVIYMNPDDLAHPVGVNLMELPMGVAGDDLLREKDLVTEATISVLRKVFSDDDSGGHRIEYILRNSIQTALTLENATLFTIFELLNDAKFRRKVVKGLEDKNLIDFWNNELGKAGEFQRVKMAAGITAKIGRFLFSASAKRVLEQPRSTIDFDDILASKKILICNFSKGLLGEDTSALFGTTILAKLQTAALRRARVPDSNRTPYYLYVDEFQNFATMSFVQMLSEARKYKLFLTMAEQSTSQQDQQRLVDIILANVGTIVCFRSGSPADERLVLPLFQPYLQPGEIANLPAYSYYVRIAAIQAQETMSGVTVVVNDKGSEVIAKRVIESSQTLYAKEVAEEKVDVDKTRTLGKSKSIPSATIQFHRKQSEGLKAETSLK